MPNIELWPEVFEIEPIPSELRTLNVLADELLPIMVNLSQTEQYKKLEKKTPVRIINSFRQI